MMKKPLFYYIKKLPSYTFHRLWLLLAPVLPDKLYLRVLYRLRMGYWMNMEHPVTFNEKLQWLKLHNRRPEYTTMVDKHAVKEYVANIIGKEHIIPTIGVWDSVEEIDFDSLPNQFVLKTTHGGGGCGVVICKDKATFDIDAAKQKLQQSINTDIYYELREWPYKNVCKRIIAEPYMTEFGNEIESDTNQSSLGQAQEGLHDYKFFCFNGKVKFFKIDFGRFTEHHANYYDINGVLLPFGEADYLPIPNADIQVPSHHKDMIRLAEKLSCGQPFVRVDFYLCDNITYFGEITFFPASGMGKFEPTCWDKEIGKWLVIG